MCLHSDVFIHIVSFEVCRFCEAEQWRTYLYMGLEVEMLIGVCVAIPLTVL